MKKEKNIHNGDQELKVLVVQEELQEEDLVLQWEIINLEQ
jgi:hypothetical protein